MPKQIIFNEEARKALKRGADKVANAVKITLGSKGRNVVIANKYGHPIITKDGVTVAREIDLEDKFENIGASIIKEVASKTNEMAGDSTTTATILAQAIITEGLKLVSAGISPIEIRGGIEKRVKEIAASLKELSKPISTREEIEQIASISANDEEIGKIIAEAMDIVGKDGIITIEEGQSFGIEKEIVEGIEFDNGYFSPYMVTNQETMKAEIEDPYILITDKRISSIKDVLPIIEKVINSGKKELVIIADNIDGEALATFVINKLKGMFNVLGVKAPLFGDRRKTILDDIAVLTGGKVISDELGIKLENVELTDLGQARKVISMKGKTTIIDGKGDKEVIKERIDSVRKMKETAETDFDKERIQERLAKLSGGVAIIKVGAPTESEMKEKKYRIEDALNATKSAVEEGVVPGGGLALAVACYGKNLKGIEENNKDLSFGERIINRAILEPIKQIANNAGVDGSVILQRVIDANQKEKVMGYDATNDKIVNMIESGIIDPTKSLRCALENASSGAMMLLTTEVVIAELPEKDNNGSQVPQM